MTIEPFSYDSDTAPTGYICARCNGSPRRLWRDYNTAASAVELRCVTCAEPDETKRADLVDSDQIAGLVPAIPTEDGDTFWGYSSVPSAGVEWWYRLPCAVDVLPSRQALDADAARAVDAKCEADRAARRTRDDEECARRCAETFAVVDATSQEAHDLWVRFHYKPDGHAPLAWKQMNPGMWREIGTFGGMPVCVTVFWALVEGRLVAFVEGTSTVVHHGMIEEWSRETFKSARSRSDAANFHNVALDIKRANGK